MFHCFRRERFQDDGGRPSLHEEQSPLTHPRVEGICDHRFFPSSGDEIRADVAVPEATELSRIVVSTVFETDTDGTTIPRLLAPRHATARHRNLSERETSLLGLPFYGHIVVLLVREHEHQSYLHGPLVG